MREIKFREAIYKDGEFVKFHYWGYDDGMIGLPFLESNKSANSKGLYVKANEQFTGRQDKDGNGIYEGDVVQVKYKTTVWGNIVKYNFKGVVSLGKYELEIDESTYEDFLGWFIKTDNGSAECFLKHISNLKIIGNIHENKEYGKAHV